MAVHLAEVFDVGSRRQEDAQAQQTEHADQSQVIEVLGVPSVVSSASNCRLLPHLRHRRADRIPPRSTFGGPAFHRSHPPRPVPPRKRDGGLLAVLPCLEALN